jgi:hypothetical protein
MEPSVGGKKRRGQRGRRMGGGEAAQRGAQIGLDDADDEQQERTARVRGMRHTWWTTTVAGALVNRVHGMVKTLTKGSGSPTFASGPVARMAGLDN